MLRCALPPPTWRWRGPPALRFHFPRGKHSLSAAILRLGPANALLNRNFLTLEVIVVLINAGIAWLLLRDGTTGAGRHISRGQRGVLWLMALNLVLILLFPPFENYYAINKAALPSFDGFYFLRRQCPQTDRVDIALHRGHAGLETAACSGCFRRPARRHPLAERNGRWRKPCDRQRGIRLSTPSPRERLPARMLEMVLYYPAPDHLHGACLALDLLSPCLHRVGAFRMSAMHEMQLVIGFHPTRNVRMPLTSPFTCAHAPYWAADSRLHGCVQRGIMSLRMFSMPWRSGASVAHFLPLFSSSFAGAAPWSCLWASAARLPVASPSARLSEASSVQIPFIAFMVSPDRSIARIGMQHADTLKKA
jgi:hypothetical protein